MIEHAARDQAFWLAARGARQADLAARFIAAAQERRLRLLALKGVAIADELWGGAASRPMADVDLLVIDTARFAEVAELARSLGLVEIDASDHALVFREPETRAVLELHISLTACPGLFTIDPDDLWKRRAPVAGSSFSRLGDVDLILHAALHTAFQHGFAANEFHYADFLKAMEVFQPDLDEVVNRARTWGAQRTLAAMAVIADQRWPGSPLLRELASRVASECPESLRRLIETWRDVTPPPDLRTLAKVRYALAPDRPRYFRLSLFPKPIPGRTLPARTPIRRLFDLAGALVSGVARQGPA